MSKSREFTQNKILKQAMFLGLGFTVIDKTNVKIIGKEHDAIIKINAINDAIVIHYQDIQYNLYEMSDFNEFLMKLI